MSAKAKVIVFRMLRELSPVELRVLLYILREVSVGEIVAFKELMKHGIEYGDAAKVFKSLVEKGYVEHVPGRCYNLSKELRGRIVREQILDIMDRLARG
ncbi:MAG: helix-turn-helix domain-containing protein [Sulfolobales archaeon]